MGSVGAIRNGLAALSVVCLACQSGFGQANSPKAIEVIDAAIQAMGGERYLRVENIYSSGQMFSFDRHGRRGPLVPYLDWTVFEPLKSRHQSRKGKSQEVYIFNFEIGQAWKMEGKKSVTEIDQERIERFLEDVSKHELDLVLRHRVHSEDIRLFYFGPDDIEGGGQFEAVEFLDNDNDSTVVYFDRQTHLPARIVYAATNSLGIRIESSKEFFNWHVFSGVKIPLRIDAFVDGKESYQQHLKEVEINATIPPDYFLEPQIQGK